MKEFEIEIEKYDYVFAKKLVKMVSYFKCKTEDEARNLARWAYGDLIDVISIKEFN